MRADLAVRTLGRYKLIQVLPGGSTATVWRAVDTLSGKTVAVKVLKDFSERALQMFVNEASQLYLELGNDYVVQLLDHSLRIPPPYIVLEFCPAGSLQRFVASRAPWKSIAFMLAHATRGLTRMHAREWVHRDIKPGNLLLAQKGGRWLVKIADFGIAHMRTEEHPGVRGAYRYVGTEGYIAPEVRAGGPITPAADMYALGVVGLELITGTKTPGHTRGLLPEEFASIVIDLCDSNPARRPHGTPLADHLEALATSVLPD